MRLLYSFSKVVISIVFISLLMASACLIFVGSYVWHKAIHTHGMTKSTYTILPVALIIGAGAMLFLLGILAYAACIKESKSLMTVFFILLLLILLVEISAGVFGTLIRGDIRNLVRKELHRELERYNNDTQAHSQIDLIQSVMECCGIVNFTDWLETPWSVAHNGSVPDSCCAGGHCSPELPPHDDPRVHPNGCLAQLKADFRRYLSLIAATAFSVTLLQVFGLLATCILMCRTRGVVGSVVIVGGGGGGGAYSRLGVDA